MAAGSAGDEEVAGSPPAQGGADGTGLVKAEPKAEPATQQDGAATAAAAAATDSAPGSSRSGDAKVDAAADGADAVKQEDDGKPQVSSLFDLHLHGTIVKSCCVLPVCRTLWQPPLQQNSHAESALHLDALLSRS